MQCMKGIIRHVNVVKGLILTSSKSISKTPQHNIVRDTESLIVTVM